MSPHLKGKNICDDNNLATCSTHYSLYCQVTGKGQDSRSELRELFSTAGQIVRNLGLQARHPLLQPLRSSMVTYNSHRNT